MSGKGFYAGTENYKLFYAGEQDEAAKTFQQEAGWHMIWGSDYQGLNGDTWVVYRAVEDLPKWLQEYAREEETKRCNVGQRVIKDRFEVEILITVEESQGDPIREVLVGDDLVKLKADIIPLVLSGCAQDGYTFGDVFVEVNITQNGEFFDHDEDWFEFSELGTWICTYKDVLVELDDDVVDNLTYVLVPTNWLKAVLREEGVVDFDAWLSEYTADSTVDIAWLAMKEQEILACDDKTVADAIRVPVGLYPRTPLEEALEKATHEAELREGQAEMEMGREDRGLVK